MMIHNRPWFKERFDVSFEEIGTRRGKFAPLCIISETDRFVVAYEMSTLFTFDSHGSKANLIIPFSQPFLLLISWELCTLRNILTV